MTGPIVRELRRPGIAANIAKRRLSVWFLWISFWTICGFVLSVTTERTVSS